MDQGHGLLDRLLVAIPLALRPTPEQLDDARERLDEMAFNDLQLLFDAIFATHTYIVRVYQLDEHCKTLHHDLQRDFAAEVNEHILMGTCPPNQRKQTLYPEWPFACPCYRTLHFAEATPRNSRYRSPRTHHPAILWGHGETSRTHGIAKGDVSGLFKVHNRSYA